MLITLHGFVSFVVYILNQVEQILRLANLFTFAAVAVSAAAAFAQEADLPTAADKDKGATGEAEADEWTEMPRKVGRAGKVKPRAP